MKYANISASGLITGSGTNASTGLRGGRLAGLIVNSHSNGTIKIQDSQIGAGDPIIVNTYTFPTGSSVVEFPEVIDFYDGLYVTIGGTADVTVVWSHN